MDKVKRIIDVNANRAIEGLRVVEEITRFVLEDSKLTARIKDLRALVKDFTSALKDINAREAVMDVGRTIYTDSEASRKNLQDIFQSNIKRSQEAVRCLEEFSKLINKTAGRRFKNIRFELYQLEKEIAQRLKTYEKFDFKLYLVTDPMKDHVKVVKEAIKGGVKIIQLRDKFASKQKYMGIARKIRKLTKDANVSFIVNDCVKTAKKILADGVHLGQGDKSVKLARKILGPDSIIGVSTHNLAEALKAQKDGADYIAIGNIFETLSKPGKKGIGIKMLKDLKAKIKIPIVAIGGVNSNNINQIKDAGIKRIAVIRAVLSKKNIRKAVKKLKNLMS